MGYSSRTLDALKLAMDLHHGQRRKGTDIPYVTHLWAVAAIVGEHGGTEDQIIAALLHDAIEDQGDKITVEQIREQFGERVAEIVAGCTDADTVPKPPWKERKQRYLAHLRDAPPHVKLVSAADKLHNARAIVTDLRRDGRGVWSRFRAGPSDQLWYFRGLIQALRHGLAEQDREAVKRLEQLIEELERAVADLERLAGA
ncbi:HD domain-containing protein [Nitrospira sp. Kam-Ns4a]